MIRMCFVRLSSLFRVRVLTLRTDAYSKTELFSLDMSSLKAGTSTPLPWNDVQSPDLSPFTADAAATVTQTPGANTQGYQPVIALAQNHVHFLGVPGVAAGNAKIFVIHCEYMRTFGNLTLMTP